MRNIILSCVTVLIVGVVAHVTLLNSSANGKKEPSKEKITYHPEIPSLRLLTPQEQLATSQLIQLMVLDDIGKGPKEPRAVSIKDARDAFRNLGPEAMPLMIQAMNYSTEQGWTCPATIIGTKLSQFIDKARTNDDLDFLEYMHANLGKGVTAKKPLEAFTTTKNLTNGGIVNIKQELANKYRVMGLSALVEKVKKSKHAEWRLIIATVPERKDKIECVDLLLTAMDDASTPTERKAVHAALVRIAGVDHGPKEFESRSSALFAIPRWREWQKEQKGKSKP